MDWSLCIICQERKDEKLCCPLKSIRKEKSEAYTTFLTAITEIRSISKQPTPIKFDFNLTISDLVDNNASWHRSCRRELRTTRLLRLKRKVSTDNEDINNVPIKRVRRSDTMLQTSCIFCCKHGYRLHEFSTLEADSKVREMATELEDTGLLSRLQGGDLIALEAKYHLQCLTSLRNRYRSFIRKQTENEKSYSENEVENTEARVFVELVEHIKTSVEGGKHIYKVSELRHLYKNRLECFGIKKELNTVRFKESLIQHFVEAQWQNDGKHDVLVFKKGMQDMLKNTFEKCQSENVFCLAKAANIVRNDIQNTPPFQFEGSFDTNCQHMSIPMSLKTMVSMILHGTGLDDQDNTDKQPCLTICQLIMFHYRDQKQNATYEKNIHIPPLPLYVGLNVHTRTRSKKLLTQLYRLGISLSYKQIMTIEKKLANSVCEYVAKIDVVCPSFFRKGLFTVGALDNIDHNPSSNTAKGSFHGTGISLFQFQTSMNLGQKQERESMLSEDTSRYFPLPAHYTDVPPTEMNTAKIAVPATNKFALEREGQLNAAISRENCWLEHTFELLNKPLIEKGDKISWSSYHASLNLATSDCLVSLSQLLPLFYEKAATPAMVKHGMAVQQRATEYLNPGQIPVTAFDAPLYAIAKYIQWSWPDTHGEDKHVIMFGGLHIEMAIWKTFGDFLEGSGWTTALTTAKVASSGTADAMLKATHLKKTRHAHEVSVVALGHLKEQAFLQTEGPHNEDDKESWRKSMCRISPTFQYWDTVLRLEILGLIFVRAHREQNFALYVETLEEIASWFFALDHQNYARWIPIHIRDMKNLPTAILQEFVENGHWVVHKSTNRFSGMPIDQAHEQNNALIKDSGGAVGLTENPSAFRKWMIAGPEQARLLAEFEQGYYIDDGSNLHHKEGKSYQESFTNDVLNLETAIKEFGNPFLETTGELIQLDTRNVFDDSCATTLNAVEHTGKKQYSEFKQQVIIDRSKPIQDPIKKNKFVIYNTGKVKKSKSSLSEKTKLLKSDVALFSKLYIATQHRHGDMNIFFSHENHPHPPSIAENGKLRGCKKSDLLKNIPHTDQQKTPQFYDMKALDGAAVVHLLNTAGSSTFDDYANNVFIPHIASQLDFCRRLDIVWDVYLAHSLKDTARERRGKGIRRKVSGNNKMPVDWKGFLCEGNNKQELFHFLSCKVASYEFPSNKEVFITDGETVLSSGSDHDMLICDHEEADTRLVVHLIDAVVHGAKVCLVRTVDTDVLVILIGLFHKFLYINQNVDIWVAFGTGKCYKLYQVRRVYEGLGERNALALLGFHSFTGCDTTSSFYGKGKKSAWEIWNTIPEVTDAFISMSNDKFQNVTTDSDVFSALEAYVVKLYDKGSNILEVNTARRVLFCQKNKSMQNIPPTQSALIEHTKRAVYQCSIWASGDLSQQNVPTPEGFGWTFDQGKQEWCPVWSNRPVASKVCLELTSCSCKSKFKCGNRCSCKKTNWACTELCSCNCLKDE